MDKLNQLRCVVSRGKMFGYWEALVGIRPGYVEVRRLVLEYKYYAWVLGLLCGYQGRL